MEILLWLVPAALTTCAAMVVAAWLGRERPTSQRQQDRAQQRFAEAMERPMTAPTRVGPTRVRSTGIAVRAARPARPGQSAQPGPAGGERRSA